MIGHLDPPFLELAFYVGATAAAEQALDAAEVLLQSGGRFMEDVEVVESNQNVRLKCRDLEEAKGLVKTKTYLRRLYIGDATGITSKNEILEVNRGIVLLRTEGEVFCGEARRLNPEFKKAGQKAYEAFKRLACGLKAAYGALCLEYTLEEPTELRRDPRSLAFQDFFVSRTWLGDDVVNAVKRTIGDRGYIESVGDGIYASTSHEYNPRCRRVPPLEAQEKSVQVARLIARTFRQIRG